MGRNLIIATALLLAVGCSSGRKRVLNPRVHRTPVVFESDRGMEAFEEALHERYAEGGGYVKPLQGMVSKNAFFNREVVRADLDMDGIISDHEALRYAKP